MPVKIINGEFAAVVQREGKSVNVTKGVPFDFNEDEVADLKKAFGDDALRDPINEEVVKVEKPAAPKKATAKKAESNDGDNANL